jgi:hypothetical protein
MTLSWFGKLASIFFFTATCLGVLRLLFICGMGLRNRHKEPVRVPSALPNDPPLQTVLIPAHNEAKVVVQTVTLSRVIMPTLRLSSSMTDRCTARPTWCAGFRST